MKNIITLVALLCQAFALQAQVRPNPIPDFANPTQLNPFDLNSWQLGPKQLDSIYNYHHEMNADPYLLGSRSTYEYTHNPNSTLVTFSYYNGTTWNPTFQAYSEYNDAGLNTLFRYQEWNGNNWEFTNQTVNTFD